MKLKEVPIVLRSVIEIHLTFVLVSLLFTLNIFFTENININLKNFGKTEKIK